MSHVEAMLDTVLTGGLTSATLHQTLLTGQPKVGRILFRESHVNQDRCIRDQGGKMAPHATLQVGDDGVAVITLTNPPVNALHPSRECTLRTIFCELGVRIPSFTHS